MTTPEPLSSAADHFATWEALTPDERALVLAAAGRGGEILDNPDTAPDCGTLVERGLVGKHEVALTPAGHALATWAEFERFRAGLRWNP